MKRKAFYSKPETRIIDLGPEALLDEGIGFGSDNQPADGKKHGSGSGVPTWGDESKHRYQHSVWDD